jgi:hypothetical protein
MQVGQRCRRYVGNAHPHASASNWIQHPRGHHDDHARHHLDMNNLTAGTALDILAPNSSTIERMPAIIDFNVLPDMGRMTARLLSDAKRGSLRAAIAAGRGQRRCIR